MSIASERIVIAAPMSFVGSAQLVWRAFDAPLLRWTVGLTILLLWWWLIIGWYLCFGLLLVPYRIVRRGQRKRRLEDARHSELLQATSHGGTRVQVNNVYQQTLPGSPTTQALPPTTPYAPDAP